MPIKFSKGKTSRPISGGFGPAKLPEDKLYALQLAMQNAPESVKRFAGKSVGPPMQYTAAPFIGPWGGGGAGVPFTGRVPNMARAAGSRMPFTGGPTGPGMPSPLTRPSPPPVFGLPQQSRGFTLAPPRPQAQLTGPATRLALSGPPSQLRLPAPPANPAWTQQFPSPPPAGSGMIGTPAKPFARGVVESTRTTIPFWRDPALLGTAAIGGGALAASMMSSFSPQTQGQGGYSTAPAQPPVPSPTAQSGMRVSPAPTVTPAYQVPQETPIRPGGQPPFADQRIEQPNVTDEDAQAWDDLMATEGYPSIPPGAMGLGNETGLGGGFFPPPMPINPDTGRPFGAPVRPRYISGVEGFANRSNRTPAFMPNQAGGMGGYGKLETAAERFNQTSLSAAMAGRPMGDVARLQAADEAPGGRYAIDPARRDLAMTNLRDRIQARSNAEQETGIVGGPLPGTTGVRWSNPPVPAKEMAQRNQEYRYGTGPSSIAGRRQADQERYALARQIQRMGGQRNIGPMPKDMVQSLQEVLAGRQQPSVPQAFAMGGPQLAGLTAQGQWMGKEMADKDEDRKLRREQFNLDKNRPDTITLAMQGERNQGKIALREENRKAGRTISPQEEEAELDRRGYVVPGITAPSGAAPTPGMQGPLGQAISNGQSGEGGAIPEAGNPLATRIGNDEMSLGPQAKFYNPKMGKWKSPTAMMDSLFEQVDQGLVNEKDLPEMLRMIRDQMTAQKFKPRRGLSGRPSEAALYDLLQGNINLDYLKEDNRVARRKREIATTVHEPVF